jgi:cation/acetate symporter
MVGLAFAIAASANFPALILSITWRGFTTHGAVAAILTGVLISVILIVLSPTVWVDIFGHESALFPLRNPALVSMPASFIAGYIGSVLKADPEALTKYDQERVRTHLGIGAH